MQIPTPTADELQHISSKFGTDSEMSTRDWIIIAACVSSITMLQMLMEEGCTIGPFELVDDGRPNSVIEAILTVQPRVKEESNAK